jgi:thiosulfate dehydrogenase
VVRDVEEPPVGDPLRGATVYALACKGCHGPMHSGADRLVDTAPVVPEDVLSTHPASDYTQAERRLVFVEKIRHGRFLGEGGRMPPFSVEALSEQALGDLLAALGLP